MLIRIGQKFGNWTVLYRAVSRKRANSSAVYWGVQCSCGKKREVRASSLRTKKSRGCGHDINRYLAPGESARNAFFCSYKYGAKTRNLVWKITKKQFRDITSKNCYYCGDLPRPMMGNPSRRGPCDLNGIDRVESKLGYIISNCVPCCSDCNVMKSDWGTKGFLRHVEKIYQHIKKEKENESS